MKTLLLVISLLLTASVIGFNPLRNVNSSVILNSITVADNRQPGDSIRDKGFKHIQLKNESDNGKKQFAFIDSVTGRTKSVFSIDENNPYKKRYSAYANPDRDNYFNFSKKPGINEFIPQKKAAHYERVIKDATVNWAYTNYAINNNNNWAVVGDSS